MDNKYLTCHECGRAIATKKGALYNPQLNTYTCSSCYAGIKSACAGRVGGFKAYWKLILGIILLVISTVLFWSENENIVLLFYPFQQAGIVFIILHIVSMNRLRRNAAAEYQAELHNHRQAKLKAELESEMAYSKPWDCPSCGAHTIGKRCEYCDSYYRE